jgi:hypothetical protein
MSFRQCDYQAALHGDDFPTKAAVEAGMHFPIPAMMSPWGPCCRRQNSQLRVLPFFEVPWIALFEADFPFHLLHVVGNGKRKGGGAMSSGDTTP